MAGSARRSVPDFRAALLVALACWSAGDVASAQELYKYRGEDGEWIYSDRPPGDSRSVEVRQLAKGTADAFVDVAYRFVGSTVELTASNDHYAPVELRLEIATLRGLSYPDPDQSMLWVLPPRSRTRLLRLSVLENGQAPFLEFGYRYMLGDPRARHSEPGPYRAPFAIANGYPITQAYPQVVTHTAPDSYYAVDIAMPVGTDIVAARDGTVIDTATGNYRAGLDIERDGPAANVVRILHDDGTYAIYAHLNTNSVRVRPGEQVRRGDYIADSGNTGYSSGPHLHFAVVRNAGLRAESVPITFLGANAGSVVPAAGELLTAY